MKFIIVLPLLVATVLAEGAPYRFSYEANDEGQHRRNEKGEHGSVQGSFSYVDPNGNLRRVNYVADEYGFRPSGDIGIDKETEAAAADLAAQAPQGNINFESPRASYGDGNKGASYGGGYQKNNNYQAPRFKPLNPRPQKTYQSPKQSYASNGNNYIRQQQEQSDFSYNTEINHQQPVRQSYEKPKPRIQKHYDQPKYQQQQDSGSYEDDDGSYGPKRTVEYEVRAPTHKITSRLN